MEKDDSKKVTMNVTKNDKNKYVHKFNIFKIILILILLMIIIPLLLILVYPAIILFILILIPIALVCIIFKGKNGTTIGMQINIDLNNICKNEEIKEGIDNVLKCTKKINKKEAPTE